MIQQNEYVMKKMFGSFFLATVISALMAQLGGLTDSVIIGHLVSPDALSVVRMWTPIESVMFIIIGVMSAGASFISTQSIGGQDYDKVNRVFNHHLYYVIVATLLVIGLVLPFTDALGSLVTNDERLVPLLTPYIHAEYFAIFLVAVCGVPMSYIISNGNPGLITRRIIISQLLNALFDLLLCGVLDMGIAGGSYATALSNVIAFSSLLGYMRKNSQIFHLQSPRKIFAFGLYRKCFVIGAPMLISALFTPVCAYIMNSLVVGKLGADGMFAFTVYFQINTISMLALTGTGMAVRNIGGLLIGEEDYDSLRVLARRVFHLLTVIMIAVSLLLFIFPDALARLFGASDSLVEHCRLPIRLLSLALLPNALAETLSSLYFVQGHHKLCRWLELITDAGAIIVIVLMAIYTPALIWYILPFTAWLVLLVTVAMAYVVHRKTPIYSWPTLQNLLPSSPYVSFSVPYTEDGVREFLEKANPFIELCELQDGVPATIALEELAYDIIEANPNRHPNETFDVRILDKEDVFIVILKSKGKPYNPIYKYEDEDIINIQDADMRRAILSRVCQDINYKYMNGINCLYLNYRRSPVPSPQEGPSARTSN